MPKRFTDTDKWKKPFIRGLNGAYKLLWFYILDDCDHAGMWHVDFEVARIRIGEDVTYEGAVKMFGDRILIREKFKWHIPDFITFQYGSLSEKNRMHQSVISILKKYSLYVTQEEIEAYSRGMQGAKEQEQDKEQVKDKVIQTKSEIFTELFGDEIFIEQLVMTHKGKDIKEAFEECYTHHSNAPNPPTEGWEWRQKLNTWLSIKGKNNDRTAIKTGNTKTGPRFSGTGYHEKL